MADVKNLFVEKEEAKRYEAYRPLYHHLPVAHLRGFWGRNIPKALDVACGTGHSTAAFAEISDSIIGCDISESMLLEARKKSQAQFILAKAEELPFDDSTFDYVNISMAFQWLDQPKFLKEAKRVLSAKGYLGIDNYGFTGRSLESEHLLGAYKSFDKQFMRTPPRNKNYPDDCDLQTAGFQLAETFDYNHDVPMNKNHFVNYLMTRSNFLELASEDRVSTQFLMDKFYESYFSGQQLTLVFRGSLMLYKPVC